MPSHPLAKIEPRLLGSLTLRLGGLLVFATGLMMFVDVPLQGDSSPRGIISFELAGTPQQALRILLEWKSRGVLGYAKLSLLVDFIYLLIYGLFFASLAVCIGDRLEEPTWSSRAAWSASLAAGFDVLENVVLLFELARMSSPPPYPQIAAGFATAKFALLLLAASYGALGGIAALRRRYRRPL